MEGRLELMGASSALTTGCGGCLAGGEGNWEMFDETMFQDRREVNAAIIYETGILKNSIENINKCQFINGSFVIDWPSWF